VFLGKKILAVVPARGGSKGIPKKNLKLWRGLSLVSRAAKFCRKCKFIDAAIISTDDTAIGIEGRKYGLEFFFKRPSKFAADSSSSEETWRHAWKKYEKKSKVKYDLSLLLEPTSPERRPDEAIKVLRMLCREKINIAMTVEKTPLKYSALKQYVKKNKTGQLFSIKGKNIIRRQQLPETYIKNGAVYCANRSFLNSQKKINEYLKIGLYITKSKINIDSKEDLKK